MEKIISERVVSERVISQGGSGILGSIFGKFNNIGSSIGGLCIAPILLILAVGVLIYGENFKRHSQTVEKLSLEQATEVSGETGMHKIQGEPSYILKTKGIQVGEVLYYSAVEEEYKEVEEKETETVTEVVDGKEVEKTIEKTKLVEKWVEKDKDTGWSEFRLGDIKIVPAKAQLEFEYKQAKYLVKSKYVYSTDENVKEYVEYADSHTPVVGEVRLTIDYVELDDTLIVVGDISSNTISNGDTFIISNKTDAELLQGLKNSETTLVWILRVFAFILYFSGFMAIFRPILTLASFIPFAGKVANGIASAIAFFLALVSVIVVTLFIKFWLLLLILSGFCIFGLLGLLMFIVVNRKSNKR